MSPKWLAFKYPTYNTKQWVIGKSSGIVFLAPNDQVRRLSNGTTSPSSQTNYHLLTLHCQISVPIRQWTHGYKILAPKSSWRLESHIGSRRKDHKVTKNLKASSLSPSLSHHEGQVLFDRTLVAASLRSVPSVSNRPIHRFYTRMQNEWRKAHHPYIGRGESSHVYRSGP